MANNTFYFFDSQGFSKHPVTLSRPTWLAGAKVLQDGKPASAASEHGYVTLLRDDGKHISAKLRGPNSQDRHSKPGLQIKGKSVYFSYRPVRQANGSQTEFYGHSDLGCGIVSILSVALVIFVGTFLYQDDTPSTSRGSARLLLAAIFFLCVFPNNYIFRLNIGFVFRWILALITMVVAAALIYFVIAPAFSATWFSWCPGCFGTYFKS